MFGISTAFSKQDIIRRGRQQGSSWRLRSRDSSWMALSLAPCYAVHLGRHAYWDPYRALVQGDLGERSELDAGGPIPHRDVILAVDRRRSEGDQPLRHLPCTSATPR